jgi:ADP-heptose:LPS heptosyltransferase
VIKKLLLLKIISLLSFFKKQNNKIPLFVSIAGIGDLFLSTPLIKNLSLHYNRKIDILINESALSIVENLDYIGKIYFISNNNSVLCTEKDFKIDFNLYTVIYSNRISYEILLLLFKKMIFIYIVPNPLYERFRLFSRITSKISNKYRKSFYSSFHILDINLKMSPPNHTYIKYLPEISSENYSNEIFSKFLYKDHKIVLINVGGKDEIRKLKPNLIENILTNNKFNFILVGDIIDQKRYPIEDNFNVINKIGKISLNQIKGLIEKVDCCILPDSLILHIASTTNTPIIALMGNALEETFGPVISTNKIVLSRLPSCSPCSKIECDKYSGFSCVQDISSQEIYSAINKILIH